MTRTVSFDVLGVAQPKGSLRMIPMRGHDRPILTSDNPKLKSWQAAVAFEATTVARHEGPMFGAVSLTIEFYLPRPKSLPRRVVECTTKPDVDKLIRAVSDALTGVLYHDDAQVVSVTARKRYAIGIDAAHTYITLAALTAPDLVTAPAGDTGE